MDDDAYFSDLTDDDKEEEIPLSQTQTPSRSPKKTRSKKSDSSGYQIKGALSLPRATGYSAQHLFDQINSGDIDLDAEYQRDVVWPTAKQVGLIDSIFRNFYMPPIIFSVMYSSDGSEKRICIDGKQRLTSIQKFMSGLIPYKDFHTGEKFFFTENSARSEKGKLLPTKYKKIFETKQIVCMEYSNLTQDSEREIFQRVQLGMALTPAEKLQAVSSPSSKFVRTLLALYVHNQLERHLEWDTTRGGDFRCVASALYCVNKESIVAPSMAALTKFLNDPEEIDELIAEDVHTTFKIFATLAKEGEYSSAFHLHDNKKLLKVSPAEFIMIFVLIFRFKGKLTMKQLSEAIEKMRWDVREAETDIRMNTRVFKHMIAFIQKLKTSHLKGDAKNDVAAVAVRTLYAEDDARKTAEDESDDEVDELEDDVKGKGRETPKDHKRKRAAKVEADEDYRPSKKVSTPARSQRPAAGPSGSQSRKRAASPPPSNPYPGPPLSSSAPPPYSSPVPTTSQQQSSRLDALHRAKAYEAPVVHDGGYAPQTSRGWAPADVGLRVGPLYTLQEPDLGRSLMERLGYSQPIATPMQSQQAYSQDQYTAARGAPAATPPLPRMSGQPGYGQGGAYRY